jgi:hypothetical protein
MPLFLYKKKIHELWQKRKIWQIGLFISCLSSLVAQFIIKDILLQTGNHKTFSLGYAELLKNNVDTATILYNKYILLNYVLYIFWLVLLGLLSGVMLSGKFNLRQTALTTSISILLSSGFLYPMSLFIISRLFTDGLIFSSIIFFIFLISVPLSSSMLVNRLINYNKI